MLVSIGARPVSGVSCHPNLDEARPRGQDPCNAGVSGDVGRCRCGLSKGLPLLRPRCMFASLTGSWSQGFSSCAQARTWGSPCPAGTARTVVTYVWRVTTVVEREDTAMDRQMVAGRFRLKGLIDRGNMGEVHRAEDTAALEGERAQNIALKLILRRRSGAPVDPAETSVKRFRREVRIMGRFDHPRIPRVVDGGVDTTDGDHLPYLAMELLDGATLRDLTDDTPQLPVSWVAAIGSQIADALYAAHAESVVHRDLKPANVMLTKGGLVKVLDFGMGLIVDDPDLTKLTSTDSTVGTARYMAPEQFAGARVTRAADLYALGCVLYELLTGGPPFDGASAYDLGYKHNNSELPPLGLLRADIPAELNRLIEQLLKKKPEQRPAHAAEVRQSLMALADGGEGVSGWDEYDPREALPILEPASLLPDTAGHRPHEAPLGI